MVASEGGAQHSVTGLNGRAYHNGPDRKTVAYALGHCDQVRPDAAPLVGKVFSAPAASGLYFIQNQQDSVLVAKPAQLTKEGIARHLYSGHPLYSLNHHSCIFSSGQFFLHCIQVIESHKFDIIRSVERGAYVRIVSGCNRAGGPAVEGVPESENLGFTGVEGGQFHSIFIRLGPAVAEKEFVVVVIAQLAQSVCKVALQVVLYCIGVKSEFSKLLREHFHIVRMAVAYADYRVSAVEVRIDFSFLVNKSGTEAFDRLDVPSFVNVKKFHSHSHSISCTS